MTSLRARLTTMITAAHDRFRQGVSADEPTEQPAESPGARSAPLACWLCNSHMVPCRRPDCPKIWRLKSCPEIQTEGKSR